MNVQSRDLRAMLAAALTAALIAHGNGAYGRGGFGGARGGGGGAAMARGGGMPRGGGSMPAISRGGGGGGRPSVGMGGAGARPSIGATRPSVGMGGGGARPSIPQRPSGGYRPPTGGLRPSPGGSSPITRPGIAGGPTTRPGAGAGGVRPGGGATTLPGTLPGGGTRPGTRPGGGAGGVRPGGGATTLPGTLPGGGTRPGTRPGGGGSAPDLGGGWTGGSRPSITLPGGGTRPGGGAGGVRPGGPAGGLTRPGGPGGVTRPGGGSGAIARPTPGDLGDFLGMGGGIRPGGSGGATTLPGVLPEGGGRPGTRPASGGSGTLRPGGGATTLPAPLPGGGGRPGGPGGGGQWRPDGRPVRPLPPPWTNRPGGWAGGIDRPIHTRPNWININNNVINNIHVNWGNSIVRPTRPGWWTRPGVDRWGPWGNNVRNRWWGFHWHNNWFNGVWWNNHWGHWNRWPGWHYGWRFNYYGWRYWWGSPGAWAPFVAWFTWSGYPQQVWSQPIYYDYSDTGNVVFQDNSVYIGGQQVATADEFAQSAAVLATVAPPATEQEAQDAEWMPLGTFAVSTNEKQTEPTRMMQLAVDRQGVISGMMFNTVTNETQAIQGQVDKETQRVAFRIGDNQNVVCETGLYNLTQNEVPLLVHYGTERTEQFLLVRLEAPPEEQAADGAGVSSGRGGDPFAP